MCRDIPCTLRVYLISIVCMLLYIKWVIESPEPEPEIPEDLRVVIESFHEFFKENEEAVLEALSRSPCASTVPDPSDIPEAPLPAAVAQGLAQPRAPFVF